MTDRELLERAARAAGYQIDMRASFMTWRDSRKLALQNPQGGHTLWNAEDDDGDALRLAVKLELSLLPYPLYQSPRHSVCCTKRFSSPDDMLVDVVELYGSDAAAATRRAIVRAAAAMAPEEAE